jgi:methylated-DNA-protein-cysteine methyltransferase-like protein
MRNEFHPSSLNNVTEPLPDPRKLALYAALAAIPKGRVVTYGQLAELAGLARAARWVGRQLSQLPEGSSLPWHRVIAAGGRLSLVAGSPAGDEQRARLRDEGVTVCGNQVDIRRHRWRPDENSG